MSKFYLALLTQHLRPRDDGFTMMEVLVAIMAATAFLLGTLQAVAINAVLQVRAERQAQATFWIQEDLETVKAAAADVINNPDGSQTFCGALSPYSAGFANQLRENLFLNLNGKQKKFTTGTKTTDTANSPLMSPVYTDKTTAYAPTNPNIQVAPSRKLVNRDYRLVRIINPDAAKLNVLKITYRVGEPNNSEKSAADALAVTANPTTAANINNVDMLTNNASGKTSIIAELYAEVIPNVVFTC